MARRAATFLPVVAPIPGAPAFALADLMAGLRMPAPRPLRRASADARASGRPGRPRVSAGASPVPRAGGSVVTVAAVIVIVIVVVVATMAAMPAVVVIIIIGVVVAAMAAVSAVMIVVIAAVAAIVVARRIVMA